MSKKEPAPKEIPKEVWNQMCLVNDAFKQVNERTLEMTKLKQSISQKQLEINTAESLLKSEQEKLFKVMAAL